jgi:hypothetical protein
MNQKKEAGLPAPLEMTNEVYFVFFLARAFSFSESLALTHYYTW